MQTNDFFVSTWDRDGGDGILQYKGFAPGLSIPVVTENIQNEMQIALDILFSARRKLQVKTDQPESKYFRGHSRRDLKAQAQAQAQGADHGADPCDHANSNAANGLAAAEKCEKAVPPAEESE